MNAARAVWWVYLLALAVSVLAASLGRCTPEVTLIASGPLPAGHPVAPGDLTLAAAPQRYLTEAVEKGKTVSLAALSRHAPFHAAGPGTPVAVRADDALVASGEIAIGKALQVCPGPVAAIVQAIHCTSAGDRCLAVVEVDAEAAATFDEAPARGITLDQTC